MQAQVEIGTGRLLAVGTFPAGSPDPATITVVELTPAQISALTQAGAKVLNGDGTITVTPPPAPPLVYSAEMPILGRVTTVGTTPGELIRFTLAPMTGYDVVGRLIGVDNGNGAVKKLVADLTIKRLGAGPLQVGTTTVTVTHADAAASTWTLTTSFSGNDGVISAVGAAGRTVDWSGRFLVTSFAPAGG